MWELFNPDYSEELLLASLLLLLEVVGETRRKYGHEYTVLQPYQNVDVDFGIASNQVRSHSDIGLVPLLIDSNVCCERMAASATYSGT